MKKLYSLLCAVAVTALAANAAAPRFAAERTAKSEFRAKAELAVAPTAAQKAQKVAKADAEEWTSLGEAQYRETLLAGLFGEAEEVLTVELQQSKSDANKYQLVNPYKDCGLTQYTNITFDETAAHNMVFHVSGNYVWIEDFDTGIAFTAQGATTSERFYISTQAAGVIEYNPTATIAQIAAAYTDIFGNIADGIVTYPEYMTRVQDSRSFYNFLISDMNTIDSQTQDYEIISGGAAKNFCIAFPDKEMPAPKPDTYVKIGTAEYTEGSLSLLLYETAPTYTVDLEMNEDKEGVFRLVNPYKNFPIPSEVGDQIVYKEGEYYMVLHLEEATTAAPYIWIEDMEKTGIVSNMTDADAPKGDMNIIWDMGSLCESYGAAAVGRVYPDGVGRLDFDTWTITYPVTFEAENQSGQMSTYYNQLFWYADGVGGYRGNMNGDFKIVLTALYEAGVEDIEAVDANAPVEYFNLQGQRVAEPAAGLYIKRQGKTVSKVVIR